MHPLTNQILQLQELKLIRDEQKIAVGGEQHLESLDKSIMAMVKDLPKPVRETYEKLDRRDKVVMAPVSNAVCTLCGLTLPTSLIQAVRRGEAIQYCPNCARMLYVPVSAPRRTGQGQHRYGPRKAGVSRFSAESLMIPRLQADDREGVIAELATCMEEEGFVDNADKLIEEALRREAILSTAVDHGLAFPHVRGVEGGGLTLAMGLHKKGVKFDDNDRKLTHVVFFIVIPTAASAFYLKLLSGLMETFRKPEAVKVVMTETDRVKLWKALIKVTRATIK